MADPVDLERGPTTDDLVLMWLAGYRAAQADAMRILDGNPHRLVTRARDRVRCFLRRTSIDGVHSVR